MKNRNIIVKQSCHSQGFLLGISDILSSLINKEKALYMKDMYAGDPRQNSSGMTALLITASGFTLIELLVVVLIIGILSAVAVPQYQKAVKKSRYARMKQMTRQLVEAQKLYFQANGVYANSLDVLDIDIPRKKQCSGWLASVSGLWKIDGFCVGIVNAPQRGTVWTSLGPHPSDWNGYAYSPGGYFGKDIVCMESRNLGSEDPHCPGKKMGGNAYGTWYQEN